MSYSIPDPRWEEPNLLLPGVKPTGPVVIDWDHPLAKGLTRCILPALMGDIDLVTEKIPIRSGTYSYDANKLNFDSSGDGVFEYGATANVAGTGIRTILTIAATNHATAEFVAIGCFNSSSGGEFFILSLDQNGGFRYFVREGGNAADLKTGSAGVTEGVKYTILGVSRSSTDHELFIDGLSVETSSNSSIPDDLDKTSLGAWQDSSPTYTGLGSVWAGLIWTRALTDTEIQSISRDPYSFLIPA